MSGLAAVSRFQSLRAELLSDEGIATESWSFMEGAFLEIGCLVYFAQCFFSRHTPVHG